ncbi:glycosyltransferase family 4 protein [Parashewanella tropica]|uniref:glycosyltransferase family 4 protein n=1 Tax=Parashewanella tropica TaxID=2547970 RepID=UPI001059C0CD|nr:glycosyltransferase family 4 protein [Parashewanella tropica]
MRKIYVFGVDHVIGKLKYFYDFAKFKGVKTTYFTTDNSKISENFSFDGDIVFLKNKFIYFFKILYFLIFKRPSHIELFYDHVLIAFFVAFFCNLFSIPVVSVCRGTEILEWKTHKNIRKIIMKFCLKTSKAVFIKELYMRKVIERHNICDSSKLVDIHNAVSDDFFNTNLFNPDSKNIVFINSFKEWRNIDLLISSFSRVLEVESNLELYLMGSTLNDNNYSPSSNDYEKRLISLVNDLNLKDRVHFIPFQPEPWLNFSDVLLYVLPADIVWLNNSLLEAMAQSIPCIIADVDGAHKILEHKHSGFITSRSVNGLADIIIDAVSNKDELINISKAASIKARDDFSITKAFDLIYLEYIRRVWK